MNDKVDNWQKLARYDTNIQGELHANLLKNNGIEVSLQALSALPGLNSGIVLWVQQDDLAKAQRILNDIAVDVDMDRADINGDDDLGAIDERENGK